MKLMSRQIPDSDSREGGAPAVKNRYFVISAFLLLLSSCGLATYPVLYEPSQWDSAGTPAFTHNINNTVNPNFITLGYDIVYRVYDDTQFASESEAESKIIDDMNSSLTNFSNIISNSWSSMGAYRRLNLTALDTAEAPIPGSSTIPIYELSDPKSEKYFHIFLEFPATSSDSYITDDTDTPLTLYFNRYVDQDDDVTKDFTYDDFDVGDVDTPFYYTKPDRIRIAFFAFTFGLSIDYLSLHSEPIYIGSLVLPQ